MPCWLYTPHFADLYLYIRIKRPRGHPCKNQVKILLWYYVIVESDTDNSPLASRHTHNQHSLFTAYSRGRPWCPNTGYGPRCTDTSRKQSHLDNRILHTVFSLARVVYAHLHSSFAKHHNSPCKRLSCKLVQSMRKKCFV